MASVARARSGWTSSRRPPGAARIVESQMADLMRQMTVEQGLDPRDFVLYAYGGAGAAHAAAFARELGLPQVVVPLGDLASTWSALGVMSSDVLHVYEHAELMTAPFDAGRINEIYAELEARARDAARRRGLRPAPTSSSPRLRRHEVLAADPPGRGAGARRGARRRGAEAPGRAVHRALRGRSTARARRSPARASRSASSGSRPRAVRTPALPQLEADAAAGARGRARRLLARGRRLHADRRSTTAPRSAPGADDRRPGDRRDERHDDRRAARSARPRRRLRQLRDHGLGRGMATRRRDLLGRHRLPVRPAATSSRSTRPARSTRRPTSDVDPVTHEVLRHALWNVNTEHGNTIMRISGSPICAYGHDFNPSILDENGDFVFFGPFLQYLSAAAGAAVKWTLEYRSENPGIRDGDMFLTNDPWVGADAPVRRGGLRAGLLGGQALLLGREHPAPVGPRRHRAGRLQPDGRRTSSGSRRASRR